MAAHFLPLNAKLCGLTYLTYESEILYIAGRCKRKLGDPATAIRLSTECTMQDPAKASKLVFEIVRRDRS